MSVLVDTSVWIEYFRKGETSSKLDHFIDENLVAVNDLILVELVPFLRIRNQQKIINLLSSIRNLALEINWNEILEFQFLCLKNGLNGIGIPDLILVQNAKQYHCNIYSLDSHFSQMNKILGLQLIT